MLKPVFVAGCERSGTTLLGSLLGELDGVVCLPESPFIASNAYLAAAGAVDGSLVKRRFERHARFAEWREAGCRTLSRPAEASAHYDAIVSDFVGQYARTARIAQPSWFVEHSPSNVLRLDRLRTAFPGAKVLHIVRDGRAVSASLLDVDWGPNDVKSAALVWSARVASGLAAEERFGPRVILRVRFEDLVTQREAVLESIGAFLDLPLRRTLGNAFRVPAYARSTHRLVGSPPDSRRIDGWRRRLTSRETEIFEATAGSLLTCLGYPREFGDREPRPQTLAESARFMASGAAQTIWNEIRRARRRSKRRSA